MAEISASLAAWASTSGGRRSENFSVVEGSQHVAPVERCGQPVGARHLEGGPPGTRREPLHRVGRQQLEPVDHGRRAVGELEGDGAQIVQVRFGDAPAQELGQQDAPGRLVFDAREDAPQDAERRRDDAAALAAVDALGQHVDPDRDHEVPPQRRGEPEAVIAEATRIEADDEARGAHAGTQVLEVGAQIGAAALLARLNEDEDAALPAGRRHQRGHGGERRVAVVRRPPPEEEMTLAYGLVGAQALAPGAEGRLLVHVSVDDDRIAAASVVHQQHRCAPGSRMTSVVRPPP